MKKLIFAFATLLLTATSTFAQNLDAPVVVHNPAQDTQITDDNSTVNVSLTLENGLGNETVYLYYKDSANSEFSTLLMSAKENNVYDVIVPINESQSLRYYFTATDQTGNASYYGYPEFFQLPDLLAVDERSESASPTAAATTSDAAQTSPDPLESLAVAETSSNQTLSEKIQNEEVQPRKNSRTMWLLAGGAALVAVALLGSSGGDGGGDSPQSTTRNDIRFVVELP